jgi:hypothetical protein
MHNAEQEIFMKLGFSLFLIVSLNLGCGVLKHTKSTSKNSVALADQLKEGPQSEELANVLPAPSPWNLGVEQKFMIIAKIARAEAPEAFSRHHEIISPLGTLSARRKYKTYPAETPDAAPLPTESEIDLDYRAVEIFLANLDNDTDHFGIAVNFSDFPAIEDKSETVTLDYNYAQYCSRVAGSVTIPMPRPYNNQTVNLHGSCNPFQACITVDSDNDNNGRQVTYDWFKNSAHGNCETYANALTQRGNFQNTSIVESFTINLNGAFQELGRVVKFKAAGQN